MTPDHRAFLERRRRALQATLGSPALIADARAGDQDAAYTLTAAREELERVQTELDEPEQGTAA